MRIAVFVKGTIFHSTFGGLETQNQALCEGLAKRGNDIHVFTPKKDFPDILKIHENITYHFVDSKFKMGMLFGFFASLDKNNWINRSYEEFVKHDKKDTFQIVISQSTAGLGVIKHKADHQFKSLMVAHGSILSEYKTFLKEVNMTELASVKLLIKNTAFSIKNFFTRQRDCVLGVNHVVAVSTFVKTALVEETFAPEAKFTVINNGIMPPAFDITQKHYTQKLFFAGRLEKSKGVHILLEALTHVKKNHPDVKLVIAGKGPELDSLIALSEELGLATTVHFAGWADSALLAKYYQEASIFVLPTIRLEGFPMTLVEASAFGLALVASDIGGNCDAIKPDENGFLVEAGNSEQLANALDTLLADVDKLQSFGVHSRKYFDHNFTRDIMIDRYQEVLNKL